MMAESIKYIIAYFVNIIVGIFLAIVGVMLTLDFQKIILNYGVATRIVISTIWVLGLLIVILKAYRINYMEGLNK